MVAYYSHASPDSRRAAMERLYGAGGRERLRDLYDRVREGRATFEEFLEELGKDV